MSHSTPRFALPHLFPGQAQKEFTFNEAMARIDMLLHPEVTGERSQEPAHPVPGETFLVGSDADGAFSGRAGSLANWDGDQWTFIAPRAGMMAFDRERAALLRFSEGAWASLQSPALPYGGAVIDQEARKAIEVLAAGLKEFGIFS
ncbi:DUF2793 domain-containing protein [Qipengyuania sp. GH1]|uniref:DUF2793 domain-containing protein n=1 Tax=Qipengyuania aestuarii TaxID=2867241 RepID=UPI001C868B67|nr:DUF2793 domain-containing protein [Qipengyuania aestuarii]MBX7536430.1 DUF2793 domain-containing protein [Qipengyuania aestuarii]